MAVKFLIFVGSISAIMKYGETIYSIVRSFIMLLYHFRNKKNGLKILSEKRLKIARINELNDPFELLGCRLVDKDLRQAFKTMKSGMSEKTGILCFSQNWQSPVQWTHYADNHKGICLGFEVKNEWLAKVDYVGRRLTCPKYIDQDFMQKVLTSKFSHWKYEKEYRGFINLDPAEEQNGLYYKDFSETLILKKVIVGCNSDISRNDISKLIKGNNENDVECFKARPAFTNFKIVRNKNEKLWT